MNNEQIRMETINTDNINHHQNPINHFDPTTIETLDLDNLTPMPLTNEQIYQAGYDYFLSNGEGPIPDNINWNSEAQHYWQQGMQAGQKSEVLYNQWRENGYNFVSQGQMMPHTDNWNAYILDAFQKGVTQALNEGKVVNPNDIQPLPGDYQNASQEQIVLEAFRQMLNENWYNQGIESINNNRYFSDKNVSSILDKFFQSRDIPISASDIINAGRRSALNNSDNNSQ